MAGEYHSLKKQHYLKLIKECAHSRKTNREWCSENGIAYSSFMRWQALLRDEAAGKVMEQQAIVPVKIAPPAPVNSIPANKSHQEIRIQKDGVSIFLPSTLPAVYRYRVYRYAQRASKSGPVCYAELQNGSI